MFTKAVRLAKRKYLRQLPYNALQTSNVRHVCLCIAKPCGLNSNTCHLLFANNQHEPPMKNRTRSILVPKKAQAAQECLVA